MKTKIYIIVSSLITLWCLFFCWGGYFDDFNVSVETAPEVVETPTINKPVINTPIILGPTEEYEDPTPTDAAPSVAPEVIPNIILATGEDKDLIAEGVVARIPTGLKNRRGERIIVKIKTCDYNKLKS
jgi:hypothetical protein